MKKHLLIFAAAALALASCEEWEPVFTLNNGDVYMYEAADLQPTATIAELKALYAKHGVLKIEDDGMIIAARSSPTTTPAISTANSTSRTKRA